MRKKDPVPFSQKFPNADPLALKLLEKLLAFDPKDRPTAEEVFLWCSVTLIFSAASVHFPLWNQACDVACNLTW